RDAELTDRMVDDPLVRLVRDVHVDLVDGTATLGEHGLRRKNHSPSRKFVDLAAVHPEHRIWVLELPRAASRVLEMDAPAPVGAELEAEEAAARPPPARAPSPQQGKPPWSPGSITTAPAPSPKSTSVERSVQSRIDERTSPPTRRPGRESPAASIPYAWATAYMKPVQPARRS